MKLEEIRTYQLAMELAEKVWDIVSKWNYFEKDTVGKQLVKAADSIAANLSEGYDRFLLQRKQTVLLLQQRFTL